MAQPPANDVDTNLIPPKEMLYDGSSSPEEFVSLGEGFHRFILVQRAQLSPNAAILDLGCGNGGVARALTRYLQPSGRYEGVDVHASSVDWLQERYRSYPNFHFTHASVYNQMYNPAGQSASSYRLPFDNASFDVVMLKSVFTHMLPNEVHWYLQEASRVLKQGGRSVITYFLLNDESRRFIQRGVDPFSLKFEYAGDPSCHVADVAFPERVVAHDEKRIRDFYAGVGWSPIEFVFGNWCGRQALIGLQDLVIAIKD